MFLIVAGILLALQIDNWNEENRERSYQSLLLNQIQLSLEADNNRLERILSIRIARKEKAIQALHQLIHDKASVDEYELMQLIQDMNTGILMSYDSGAYEALKSAGLHLIKNQQLRGRIIRYFESTMPVFKRFIEDTDRQVERRVQDLEAVLFKEVQIEVDGKLLMVQRPAVENILQHPDFWRLMAIHEDIADHHKQRIEAVLSRSMTFASMLDDALITSQ